MPCKKNEKWGNLVIKKGKKLDGETSENRSRWNKGRFTDSAFWCYLYLWKIHKDFVLHLVSASSWIELDLQYRWDENTKFQERFTLLKLLQTIVSFISSSEKKHDRWNTSTATETFSKNHSAHIAYPAPYFLTTK